VRASAVKYQNPITTYAKKLSKYAAKMHSFKLISKTFEQRFFLLQIYFKRFELGICIVQIKFIKFEQGFAYRVENFWSKSISKIEVAIRVFLS